MSDAPKSALELALAKLDQQDAENGVEATPLTDAQAGAIAGVRRTYEAHAAESRILHQSALATTPDPGAPEELETNQRRDMARFASDRDRKIERIRTGAE